ncbi:VCBS repeat-containing protein [Thalassobacillus pellis]|uniref:VCBS repeat-containing protein n=1 Tax=Thalassobacillus pellis TaxID=748008 RepID=UPI001EF770AE|nr:VCBS repeat-containing protein [Thalassobacillus pellis]MBM7553518.1 hypothetical protein [Thalassobacillus pellis]
MDAYLSQAIHYFSTAARKTNHPYYWYCLASAQARAGLARDALHTLDSAMLLANPYPSRQSLLEMRRGLQATLSRQMNQNRPSIVAEKWGNIDGDDTIDKVTLTATKTSDSPLWQNINLEVQNGKTNQVQRLPLKNNMGYNPTLFLGDFTGNKVDDILVVIDTGGSGGSIYAYIFSDRNGQLRQIFDSDSFNEAYNYKVNYDDNYQATVISERLKEKYVLDLTYKGKDYLSEIYTPKGNLKEPISGWVNPLSGLYPIDYNRDGTYELEGYQSVAGRYNADTLGYMLTVLKWNWAAFTPERQNIAIFGGPI